MCYCNVLESKVLHDLKRGAPPEEALVTSCCWKTICRVRGRNYNQLDAETWIDICRKRGYLFARQNPRGF
jgi:hypothetical protein